MAIYCVTVTGVTVNGDVCTAKKLSKEHSKKQNFYTRIGAQRNLTHDPHVHGVALVREPLWVGEGSGDEHAKRPGREARQFHLVISCATEKRVQTPWLIVIHS